VAVKLESFSLCLRGWVESDLESYKGGCHDCQQTRGRNHEPQRPAHNHKRGRLKQTFARNLVERLEAHQHDILRFAAQAELPFDNNLAERDLRMVKLKEKISGTTRGQGAVFFARIRGYISTLRKQDIPTLPALEALFKGQPVLPNLTE
jgi:transposase